MPNPLQHIVPTIGCECTTCTEWFRKEYLDLLPIPVSSELLNEVRKGQELREQFNALESKLGYKGTLALITILEGIYERLTKLEQGHKWREFGLLGKISMRYKALEDRLQAVMDDITTKIRISEHPVHKFNAPVVGGGLGRGLGRGLGSLGDFTKCTRCGKYELDPVHAESQVRDGVESFFEHARITARKLDLRFVETENTLAEARWNEFARVATPLKFKPIDAEPVDAQPTTSQRVTPTVTITAKLLRSWSEGGTLLGIERANTCSFQLGELADRLNEVIASEIERQMVAKAQSKGVE
jgi:hypothetical protein